MNILTCISINRRWIVAVGLIFSVFPACLSSQEADLTVQQIMQQLITPATNVLWGAYDIQEAEQWQSLEQSAFTLLAAGELMEDGGSAANDQKNAANSDWQEYNAQMLSATRAALAAIRERDEEALFAAGNDQLYPPCESCHQAYMTQ